MSTFSYLSSLVIAVLIFSSASSARTHVDIKDASVLKALEDKGFGIGHVFEADAKNLNALYQESALYRSFVKSIGKEIEHDPKTDQLPDVIPKNAGDIPEMVRLVRGVEDKGKRSSKDKKGGFYIRHLSNNSKYPYAVEYDGDEPRHFDHRWLTSKHATFALAGVVNRIDKRDFGHGACGEVRFIYRLSYRSQGAQSSMPFFLNAVYRVPGSDCKSAVRNWVTTKTPTASWLSEGALKGVVFDRLETNFQSLRFTSGYMHDFGGQAMYMQRVYQRRGDKLVPIALENTPNVLEVKKNPELLKKFVAFLKEGDNLKKLDEGRLVVDFDERFLATRSVSWSTLGRERNANKPYRELLEKEKALFEDVDYSSYGTIKNVDGLIERLDNLTCAGCHQSGGTAGFHFLGEARDDFSHGFNRQELALSPHASAEVHRRTQYMQAMIDGESVSAYRPHSMMPRAQFAKGKVNYTELTAGAPCSLGAFEGAPSCEEGLQCERTASSKHAALFGECVLKKQPGPEGYFAGGVCFDGRVVEEESAVSQKSPPTYNFFAFRDKFKLKGRLHKNLGKGKKSARYSCASPKSGAPLGRRGRACTKAEETFKVLDGFGEASGGLASGSLRGKLIPNELCANQGGNGFDHCAASGNAGSCLESRVARSMLDTCSEDRFCREDYICQKFPEYQKISAKNYGRKRRGKRVNQAEPGSVDGSVIQALHEQGVGFCVPTYFLFNMRVDGHPSPVSGKAPGPPKIDRSQPLRGYK